MEVQAVVNNPIQQPPVKPMPPKQNHWIIAIIILVFLIVLGSVYILGQRLQKQMVPPPPEPPIAPKITLQPSPVDETANWKTYRNEELGFEVRHPLDWLFLEEKSYVGISPCTLEQDIRDKPFVCGLLRFNKKIESGSLNDLLENQYSEQQGFAIIDKRELEQFTLVKMGVQASIAQHYLLYDAQRKKTIELTNREGLIEEKIFDQILSTFKFTNPEDQVVCTADAKLCPDGSYVSRKPPNCEFAACP